MPTDCGRCAIRARALRALRDSSPGVAGAAFERPQRGARRIGDANRRVGGRFPPAPKKEKFKKIKKTK